MHWGSVKVHNQHLKDVGRFLNLIRGKNSASASCTYVQGQEPEPRIREYFYYIDHEGMLFLDDAKMKNFTSCFKEKQFLRFFFNRVKINDLGRYQRDFPYLSPCGRERNFIRCDDTPIVFTHILQNENGEDRLAYNHAGELLSIPFQPQSIYMEPTTGRVYHPAWPKVGDIGLVRSKLAIELSKLFEFDDSQGEQLAPTFIWWRDSKVPLQSDWVRGTKRLGLQPHSHCNLS